MNTSPARHRLLQTLSVRGARLPESAPVRLALYVLAGAAYGIARETATLAQDGQRLLIVLVAISFFECYRGPKVLGVASALSVVCAAYLLGPLARAPELALLLVFAGAVLTANFTGLKRQRLARELMRERDELAKRLDIRTAELQRASERLTMEARQRAAAEESLQAAQEELASRIRAMSAAELTAAIAHEINQPMTGLATQCVAAINWLDRNPPDVEEARQSVQAAARCAERVAEVVAKLRSAMSGQPVGPELVDLNAVVRSALGQSSRVVAFGRENIGCNLLEDLPLVRGDRAQLELVVLNLLANAVEAMESARVERKRLEIRTYVDQGDVCLTVADSGPGLPVAADVFRPFYSTKANGLGVGLSICRSVVVAHRGTINCDNRKNGGAIVQIRIPSGVSNHECDPGDGVRDRRRFRGETRNWVSLPIDRTSGQVDRVN